MLHVDPLLLPNPIGSAQSILERQIFASRGGKQCNQLAAVDLLASGITQLTGDVTAGPGSGSQAAIVVPENAGLLNAHRAFMPRERNALLLAKKPPPGLATKYLDGSGNWSTPAGTPNPYPFAFTAPIFGDWTARLGANGAVTDQTGNSAVNGIYIKSTANASARDITLIRHAAPANNVLAIFSAALHVNPSPAGGIIFGFYSTVSNPGRMVFVEFISNTDGQLYYYVIRISAPNGTIAIVQGPSNYPIGAGSFYNVAMLQDGTNIKFYVGSADGYNFDDNTYSETLAAYIGSADNVCVGVDAYSTFAAATLCGYTTR
jgi:hypothetical protein